MQNRVHVDPPDVTVRWFPITRRSLRRDNVISEITAVDNSFCSHLAAYTETWVNAWLVGLPHRDGTDAPPDLARVDYHRTKHLHGGDGKSWQSLIGAFREFMPAFQLNMLNSLQVAAGLGSPINIWADPVYWPFFSHDRLFATQASTLVAYMAIATAIFVLSRIWRVPPGASIAGAVSNWISFLPFRTFSVLPPAEHQSRCGHGGSVDDHRTRRFLSGQRYAVENNRKWSASARPMARVCPLQQPKLFRRDLSSHRCLRSAFSTEPARLSLPHLRVYNRLRAAPCAGPARLRQNPLRLFCAHLLS